MNTPIDGDGAEGAAPPRTVVVLGAGRGGTTLLYKLLALHRDVGYLSNYQARLPGWPSTALLHRLIRTRHDIKTGHWFKEDGGAYFGAAGRSLIARLVPVPAEAETLYRSCGVPLTPDLSLPPDGAACARLARAFGAVRRHAGAQVLVTKRTANNRRIPWLEAAFPQCRYLLLLRDGRAVASSLTKVEWWSDHVLFWSGRTPRQMVHDGHDEVALAAHNWVEAMRQIEAGLRTVPPQRVMRLRYEDLLANPMPLLRQAFEFIGTPVENDPLLDNSIAGLKLRPTSGEWGRGWSEEQRATVQNIQGAELTRWGYGS